MTASPDLDAYFRRIGWTGSRSPTFDTLAGLIQAHTATVPFENLDVLLGRPVRLDLGSLHDKLIHARRGGYCFEHVTLFSAALETLGFQVRRHAARVVLFAPASEVPRNHMFLTVAVEGVWFVADPGFGPFAPRFPVPLCDTGASGTGQNTHRVTRAGDLWTLHVPRDGQTVPGWVSTLEHENKVDFEVANHFTATHPASPFVNSIMLSAPTPEGRINVMNRDVTFLTGSQSRQEQIADRAALRALLGEHFGFDLPEVETLKVPAIPEWQ
ncbi:MAG TPA: arylamine N-acetyltransferase [Rhodopila sp.]